MDYNKMLESFGLLGVVIGGVLTMFFFIIKWVLAQFKCELEGNHKERSEYLSALAQLRAEMSEHNARAREFSASTQSEHREMIVCLGRINGFKE
jgi:hypothetical protein